MTLLRPLLLLLWLAVASAPATAEAPAEAPAPPAGDGAALFDEAWRTAKDHFYDAALSEADWQRLRAAHRPAGGIERAGEEVAARIDRMLDEFGFH